MLLRRSFIFLFIAVGVILPLVLLRYYMPIHDECYQALNIRSYEISPLAMLTFYIGSLWCGLFGDTLISLRELMQTRLLNQYHYYDSDTLMVNSTVSKLSHASIIFLTKGEGQSEDYYKNTMNALKKEGYVKEKFRENYYLYTKISK